MNDFKEEMDLINNCEFISDKLSCFSAYLNIVSVSNDVLSNYDSQNADFFRNMMKAYLKVSIQELSEPVSASVFMKMLLRGVKVNPVAQNARIADVISLYEDSFNSLNSYMPYVNEINSLSVKIEVKERFVAAFREFLSTVFSNFSRVLEDSSQVDKIKLTLINDLSKEVKELIKKSNSYEYFINNLRFSAMTIILDEISIGNFDVMYLFYKNNTIQTLSFDDRKVLELLAIFRLTSSDSNFNYNSLELARFICERLSMRPHELRKSFSNVGFILAKLMDDKQKKIK